MKSEDIFKFIGELAPVILTITSAAFIFLKYVLSYYFNYGERIRIVKILNEIDTLKIDNDFREIVIQDYKRVVLKETKGLNVSVINYSEILKSGILNKFSISQIKKACSFFKFDKGFYVKIGYEDVFIGFFYLLLSLIYMLFTGAYLIFQITMYRDMVQTVWSIGYFAIAAILGMYLISMFFVPLTIAYKIKRELALVIN